MTKQKAAESDFLNRHITQTDYRGGSKIGGKVGGVLDTDLPKIELEESKKMPLKKGIREKIQLFLSKVVDEKDVEEVMKTAAIKKIFKILGI